MYFDKIDLDKFKTSEMELGTIKFVPITETYDLYLSSIKNFSCGNSLIEGYLKNESNAYRDHMYGITSTTTLIYKDEVIGFFTANCSSLEIQMDEARALGLIDDLHIPAVEVKFLAIRTDLNNRGIGTYVLKYIIGTALGITSIFTCRYIFLWSLEERISFYERRFFSITGTEENGLHLMKFLIPTYNLKDEL